MITLYGIKNCDQIKKAKTWLTEQGVDFSFHDYRIDGLEKQQLALWCKELHWQTVLNKRGTTWRKLDNQIKESINESQAIELMLQQPAMIKRPILDLGNQRIIGFSDALYQKTFLSEERQHNE